MPTILTNFIVPSHTVRAWLRGQEKSTTNMGKLQLELSSLKQQYSDALGQLASTADIRAQLDALVHKNAELRHENDELTASERQTSTVVKQLMQDIETMKKGT